MAKYLDESGVRTLWSKIKSYVTGLGYTKNTGTVTSVAVKINGATKGTVTSSGTIDLGTTPNTTNTAGASSKTGTKMYIVGATSQTDGIQSYSNANCYIGTDNCLYSGGNKVVTDISSKANASETGYSLTVSGTSIILKNKNGTQLSSITIPASSATVVSGTCSSVTAFHMGAFGFKAGITYWVYDGDDVYYNPPIFYLYQEDEEGDEAGVATAFLRTGTSTVRAYTGRIYYKYISQ